MCFIEVGVNFQHPQSGGGCRCDRPRSVVKVNADRFVIQVLMEESSGGVGSRSE